MVKFSEEASADRTVEKDRQDDPGTDIALILNIPVEGLNAEQIDKNLRKAITIFCDVAVRRYQAKGLTIRRVELLADPGYCSILTGLLTAKEAMALQGLLVALWYDLVKAEMHFQRFLFYFDQNDLDRSFEEIKEANRIDPGYAGSFVYLGNGYKHRGNLPKAIAAFEEFIRLATDERNKGRFEGIIEPYKNEISELRKRTQK